MESTEVKPPPPAHTGTRDPVRTVPRAPVATPAHENGNGNGAVSHDDWGQITPVRNGKVILVSILVFLALAALFATGFIPRVHNTAQLNADAKAAGGPIPVSVVQPKVAPSVTEVMLPGTLRPWQEVSIYARSTGYLRKWYADISNQVKQGQLLAEIDSPEG